MTVCGTTNTNQEILQRLTQNACTNAHIQHGDDEIKVYIQNPQPSGNSFDYSFEDVEIVGYESHPAIKAPGTV